MYLLSPKGVSSQEEVQKELKIVLRIFREKKSNSINSNTQEIWLNQYSTPGEVQTWLAAKGFSQKYIDCIYVMNYLYLSSSIDKYIL